MHHLFTRLSALLLFSVGIIAVSHAAEPQFQEGVHYQVLPQPVRTSDPKRIEVAEVFWYGCPHCFEFSPMAEEWSKTLPEDVAYVRSPAIWQPRMELHARAFYTAKALDVLDKMHQKIFDTMNVRRKRLKTEREIAEVFAEAGIDGEKFSSMFNSFGIISQVMQAKSRTMAYRITGTPAMIVNGKYQISGQSAGSNAKMLEVAQFLVEKERQAAQVAKTAAK